MNMKHQKQLFTVLLMERSLYATGTAQRDAA